jgi:hypothetical protein
MEYQERFVRVRNQANKPVCAHSLCSATDGRLSRRFTLLFSLQPILKVTTGGAAALHEQLISAVLNLAGINYGFPGGTLLVLMYVMFHVFCV